MQRDFNCVPTPLKCNTLTALSQAIPHQPLLLKKKKKFKIKFWGWLMAALARGKLMLSWFSKVNPEPVWVLGAHLSSGTAEGKETP